jgi:hypothetical protein
VLIILSIAACQYCAYLLFQIDILVDTFKRIELHFQLYARDQFARPQKQFS